VSGQVLAPLSRDAGPHEGDWARAPFWRYAPSGGGPLMAAAAPQSTSNTSPGSTRGARAAEAGGGQGHDQEHQGRKEKDPGIPGRSLEEKRHHPRPEPERLRRLLPVGEGGASEHPAPLRIAKTAGRLA